MNKNPSSRKIKESNNPNCSTTRPEMLMLRLKSLHPLRSLPHLLTSKSHNQPSFHRSFSLSHLSHNFHYFSLSHLSHNFHYNIPPFQDEMPPPANWGIVMVPENQAYVVERLGGFQKTLYSGIHFLIPVVDRITHVHSLKEEVFLIPDTCGITKDDARILIDSVIHVKIVDPLLASYQFSNQILVVANLSSRIMLKNLRKMNLNEILEEMDTLNENIMSTNEVGTPLGVKCLRYAIRDISPLPKVGAIIEMQAKAKRRKLAQVLESEGVLSIMSIILLGLLKLLIMSIIMNCFSLFWCFPGDVIHLLQAWHGVYLGKAKTIIRRTAILAVWWSVWGERNSRCFRNLSNSAGTVASKAKRLIIEWVSNVKDLFGPDFFFLGV